MVIVGIGMGTESAKVIASAKCVSGDIDVKYFTSQSSLSELISSQSDPSQSVSLQSHIAQSFAISDEMLVVSEHPEEALTDALAAGEIDAAVRGTLPAGSTLGLLKKSMGVSHLERIALLETAEGKQFLLAPVGVDEGWTVDEKVSFIKDARGIAGNFGLNDRVAVLSGGRLGDVGRHPAVDRSLADAELVARLTGADHMEILIEDAVLDHGIIIAPDGITGNIIFRTLSLLGGGFARGAPVLNIAKIFVDTSRGSSDYSNAILLAASLVRSD
ncbi:MAG: methanogenesis marker protein Mmp4/MtxX [Euryarchaeota archaeon]|nr:methanogenesis marker protein Mmp4/MtxX [Euryarchaeota archaeon]